jgi:hypothetical protein
MKVVKNPSEQRKKKDESCTAVSERAGQWSKITPPNPQNNRFLKRLKAT